MIQIFRPIKLRGTNVDHGRTLHAFVGSYVMFSHNFGGADTHVALTLLGKASCEARSHQQQDRVFGAPLNQHPCTLSVSVPPPFCLDIVVPVTATATDQTASYIVNISSHGDSKGGRQLRTVGNIDTPTVFPPKCRFHSGKS